MSAPPSPLDLAHRFLDAFGRRVAGDESADAELDAMLHPAYEAHFHEPGLSPAAAAEHSIPRGDAFRAIAEFAATWEDVEAELTGFVEIGQSVVHDVHFRARGRGSGVPYVGRGSTAVLTFRDGLLVRQDFFGQDREGALAFARELSEGDGPPPADPA